MRNIAASCLLAITLLQSGAVLAFDLQGHRGARGLAPENTLAAFGRALEVGVTTIELDVHLSADGVPMVSHNPALNPDLTRDASGRWLAGPGPLIRALTVDQLRAFDIGRARPGSDVQRDFPQQRGLDGERLPTLAELFDLVRRRGADAVHFNIEIKTYPRKPGDTPPPEEVARVLLDVVRSAGMASRVTVQSFDWRALQAVQRLAPGMPTAYLTVQRPANDTVADGLWTAGFRLAEHGSVPRMVKAAGGSIWSPNGLDLSAALVKEAHSLGLQVLPWTVNKPADMALLIGWGVDGLITDRPDLAREVMAERGLALPAAFPP